MSFLKVVMAYTQSPPVFSLQRENIWVNSFDISEKRCKKLGQIAPFFILPPVIALATLPDSKKDASPLALLKISLKLFILISK